MKLWIEIIILMKPSSNMGMIINRAPSSRSEALYKAPGFQFLVEANVNRKPRSICEAVQQETPTGFGSQFQRHSHSNRNYNK